MSHQPQLDCCRFLRVAKSPPELAVQAVEAGQASYRHQLGCCYCQMMAESRREQVAEAEPANFRSSERCFLG